MRGVMLDRGKPMSGEPDNTVERCLACEAVVS